MAYVAFFDANALVPYVVCDLLLRLADDDLFRLVGQVRGSLEMACSRCLEPFTFTLDPSFDLRYLPQNLALMLGSLPVVLPRFLPDTLRPEAFPVCVGTTVRGLFYPACPLAVPRDVGTSLLLSSPAYLLVLPVLRRWGRSRLVTGALLAIGAIALVNLMHFSQGWVQFGYRFSNDFAPFALLLVVLGIVRLGGIRWPAALLIGASILVNLWGVIWGNVLGW